MTRHSGKTENRMREQFEVISQTIPVPMIISTKAGEVFFANLNAQKIFGYSFDEFTKLNASLLYHNPEDRKGLMKILMNRGEVEGFRTDLKKHDASLFPAVLFSKRIFFDDHESFLTIVHDLTEVMSLEKQLRQTQKMEAIGTLASGIAHDFNNILAAIMGYTELIRDSMDSETEQKTIDYLDKVQKAANRAKSMIMQMTAFYRKPEKENKPFRISAIISEVVKMMSELTPSNIDIRWDIPSDNQTGVPSNNQIGIPSDNQTGVPSDTQTAIQSDIQSDIQTSQIMVTGDSTQIHQVVTNLITNSVQALSSKGGTIDVLLEKKKIVSDFTGEQPGDVQLAALKPGTYARITVKDNGPGISEIVINNIFDPFFSTKPVGQGSGMGLAVVHGIMSGHNGSVTVDSKPGQGAAFHCYFPVTEKEDGNVETVVYSEFEIIQKGNEHVLLIDDETMILEVCNEILLSMGYRVTPCEGSRGALDIFKLDPKDFDLVITDNTMPEMSGIELTEEILKVRQDIPVILMTGDLVKNESDFKKTGIRAYIQKPFDIREMQSVIYRVLARR
ncbi:putative Histidine kinase [Desulfamplus magnetovallimortis]|uniref:histidine kinase n=1 Tax=Desulfamplus magnetovallimortis TaxID=1246637 RepID=A0A1W1H6K2_9BACT|nr:ATP-binding protein [Desulfamplus magnetovallimortis]SLM28074.1 putative Histidine kinase [Desulfamplus magnetovallimortis]